MKRFVRKKPNPTRNRNSELKTGLILEAARELFAAQGYENTPTAQLA